MLSIGLGAAAVSTSFRLEMRTSFNVMTRKLDCPAPALRCVSTTSLMCFAVRQALRRLGDALSTCLPTTKSPTFAFPPTIPPPPHDMNTSEPPQLHDTTST